MKNIEKLIDEYINKNAEYLAECIANEEEIEIRVFYCAEDNEYEVTICDDASEEGDWDELAVVSNEYIEDNELVAELLNEYIEDSEAYKKDAYSYYGLTRWDFY